MTSPEDSRQPLARAFIYWCISIFIWLLAGVSLGWYYTFTYYGRAGWPIPMVEFCAALILYYFSVLNVDTEIQAVHWLLVFPTAGAIWTIAVWTFAPRFGLDRPVSLSIWTRSVALSALPIALAGMPMTLFAAASESGLDWRRMIDVALRRGFESPPSWLTPVYFLLGIAGLVWQVVFYRRQFRSAWLPSLRHLLVSAIAAVLAACVLGAVLGMPLRLLFE